MRDRWKQCALQTEYLVRKTGYKQGHLPSSDPWRPQTDSTNSITRQGTPSLLLPTGPILVPLQRHHVQLLHLLSVLQNLYLLAVLKALYLPAIFEGRHLRTIFKGLLLLNVLKNLHLLAVLKALYLLAIYEGRHLRAVLKGLHLLAWYSDDNSVYSTQ